VYEFTNARQALATYKTRQAPSRTRPRLFMALLVTSLMPDILRSDTHSDIHAF